MSEKSQVENPCVDWATRHKIPALKVNPMWYAGWNDRIFFVPGGKPLIIEFKAPLGRIRPKQVERHANLRKLGYDVHVVGSKEEGIALLQSRYEAGLKLIAGDAPGKARRTGVGTAAIHAKGDEVATRSPVRRAHSRSRSAKD